MNNLYEFSNKEGTAKAIISVANVVCFTINDTTNQNYIIYADYYGSTPTLQHLNGFTYDDIRKRLPYTEGKWIDVEVTVEATITGDIKGRLIVNRDYILAIEPTDDPDIIKIYVPGLKQFNAHISYDEILKKL